MYVWKKGRKGSEHKEEKGKMAIKPWEERAKWRGKWKMKRGKIESERERERKKEKREERFFESRFHSLSTTRYTAAVCFCFTVQFLPFPSHHSSSLSRQASLSLPIYPKIINKYYWMFTFLVVCVYDLSFLPDAPHRQESLSDLRLTTSRRPGTRLFLWVIQQCECTVTLSSNMGFAVCKVSSIIRRVYMLARTVRQSIVGFLRVL